MRLKGFGRLLGGVFALLVLFTAPGCQNPLDPLDQSDKIEGLSHFDFSLTWDLWDSDPAYDGLTLELTYYNELHETLEFHDKPHTIVVEFWSPKNVGELKEDGTYLYNTYTKDKLFYKTSITYVNSDDVIHIPVEAYYQYIPEPESAEGETTEETQLPKSEVSYVAYVVVKIYPPQEYPKTELLMAQYDGTAPVIYQPNETVNGLNP